MKIATTYLSYCFGISLLILTYYSHTDAQTDEYLPQLKAWEMALKEKRLEPLEGHLSPDLYFFNSSPQHSATILGNFLMDVPDLEVCEIIDADSRVVNIKYQFAALGERTSRIFFDGSGRIIRIELIDNLLEQQQRYSDAIAKQEQRPQPDKLTLKYPPQKIEFPSSDGLLITGNLYEINPERPVILLCHQAGYNKYEYADIAPRLNELGFNALAIDQRSGGTFAGQQNETFQRARARGMETKFVDAEKDIITAIDYLTERYGKQVVLLGSSYSAALAFYQGKQNDKISAVISFSPGDYFTNQKESLEGQLKDFHKPFFITSSREEADDIRRTLLKGVKLSGTQVHFIPSGEGFHGSRSLWVGQKGREEYWIAVAEFLNLLR